MKILIVSGGSISLTFAGEFLKLHRFDRVIAADAGLAACDALSLCPTDILGDFDSLTHLELKESYGKKGIPVREFPTRKDYTDTHLAILYAIDLWKEGEKTKENVDKDSGVWILGGTGTRFDHTLANVGLLMLLKEHGIPAVILDAYNEIELLKGPCEKIYRKKEDKTYFSLLPFSDVVEGIDLIGFSYPLEDASLKAYESMGISNEITDDFAVLRIKDGYMLVVQARD